MSSKKTHTLAGIATGGLLIYFSKLDAYHSLLLLLGAVWGASAPDWLEIHTWISKRHWFSPNESQRLSLIPHRTITHTLSIWALATLYCSYFLAVGGHEYAGLFGFAFCASVVIHLLLDICTPMGIPLMPFGKRYRLQGLKLVMARQVNERCAA